MSDLPCIREPSEPALRTKARDAARVIKGRHLEACEHIGRCAGCQPCPERHCQVCGRGHVTVDGVGSDQTCATCLGETRSRVSAILVMSTALLGEALIRGVSSEAAFLAGPAASPEAWSHRRMSSLAQRIDPGWLDDQVDMLHPCWVLGTWEREIRIHVGKPPAPEWRPTLSESTRYVGEMLTRVAHDSGFAFEELADEIRLCHDHLERVLHLGEHLDEGVDCPRCGRARLAKSYGAGVDDDRWVCSRCGERWTEHDYRAKVTGTYLAVAKALTASQIREQYRIPEGTVRSWAARGKVARRGTNAQGLQVYDVSDTLAARDAQNASGA